jgi:hypothetical protein
MKEEPTAASLPHQQIEVQEEGVGEISDFQKAPGFSQR